MRERFEPVSVLMYACVDQYVTVYSALTYVTLSVQGARTIVIGKVNQKEIHETNIHISVIR